MQLLKTLVLALPIVSLAVLDAREASACGGCFVSQSESTQVTGHRMILSVSNDQTTLWDQITYSGAPNEFGWVLPIKGKVEVGLSSDALFATLETLTEVVISSPTINCTPPGCFGSTGAGAPSDGAGGGSGGGVTVIAQEVVGPYQTVQLEATDPAALKNWLQTNGYSIPPDVTPVIDSYVSEGFGFLALKLIPGEGIDSMRPVRVTSSGANPLLPLRMVSAGTGAITSITLWVIGEGRYEPKNGFSSFEIKASDLVWDWDKSTSNYKDLRQAGFDSSGGKAWLIESAEPSYPGSIEYPLTDVVTYNTDVSGYDEYDGKSPDVQLSEDLAALTGTIDQNSMWLMRMHGELPRSALAKDLEVGASMNQDIVARYLQANQTIGTAPECPPVPQCPDPADSGEDDTWDGFWDDDSKSGGGSGSACAMTGGAGSHALLGGIALSAALLVSRRRRARKSS